MTTEYTIINHYKVKEHKWEYDRGKNHNSYLKDALMAFLDYTVYDHRKEFNYHTLYTIMCPDNGPKATYIVNHATIRMYRPGHPQMVSYYKNNFRLTRVNSYKGGKL